ncbi:MAG: protein-glutamate O-methyltransferase CheR [Fibrobacterota bacterium]
MNGGAAKDKANLEKIEFDLLLEGVFRRYGYDFRSYARASLDRRVRLFMSDTGCDSISALIPLLLRDREVFAAFARRISVTVTEMFRDPFVYRALREKVVPWLRTWPHFKIWHAGCATGEEVYSLAILLKEEGIYDRATIYATDFNDDSIDRSREGVYPVGAIKDATSNYLDAGGKATFSDYYHSRYDAVALDPALRERVTFANHNLAVDGTFGEMNLILCRNVMIYFDRNLQDRAMGLFADSLVHGGVLCVGTKEDVRFSSLQDHFLVVDAKAKLFQKRGESACC